MRKEDLRICIIDDEKILRITIYDELIDQGYEVHEFENPYPALEFIKDEKPDIVLTDVKMPQLNGIAVLKEVKKISPDSAVIVMTAYGSVHAAIEAIKLGAFNYLTKPFKQTELNNTLEQIAELRTLRISNKEFKQHFKLKYNLDTIWGDSKVVNEIKEAVELVAASNSSVLITGETGTGKELIANVIHYSSRRANKPLIKVSCAILAADVIESELFGHEKGAFTGANNARIGRFEEADSGTIFLDDVDDIPLGMQVKLLRVLQEQEFERVGSSKSIKINVRVVASTKAELQQLISEGRFREDLFYRLNVFPINLAPLRERKSDIPLFIDNFIKEYSNGMDINVEESVYELLKTYDWPGNVRELKNFVERSIILARNGKIERKIVPIEFCKQNGKLFTGNSNNNTLPELMNNFEKEIIIEAIEKTNGNKNKVAELLGIPLTTLRSKIEKLNIS